MLYTFTNEMLCNLQIVPSHMYQGRSKLFKCRRFGLYISETISENQFIFSYVLSKNAAFQNILES